MQHFNKKSPGFTLLELLCVIAIITLLAGLLAPSTFRVLQRTRADQWADRAQHHLYATVEQLNRHYQGKQDFPPVTLETIEAKHLLKSGELRFLKDPQVTFTPFSGSDPDEMVVIQVRLERGFLSGPGTLTATKGSMTRIPD